MTQSDNLTDGVANPERKTPSNLDVAINQAFPGAVVRKDLVKTIRGNAVVPTYVLEYLLGQYAASDDESTIQAGIESVKQILEQHYVNRHEHELVKSKIRDKGRLRIIDKVSVVLNEKDDIHEASFENLQLKGVPIDDGTVKKNPKLLVAGVWCICTVDYIHDSDSKTPWILSSLKPIQNTGADLDEYISARDRFTTDQWIDLLMQSIGLNPEKFTARGKLIALTRLVPFVERNYNLVELGPKGTGKSHVFSEFSPNGILISGGEVTVAKLFVNNSNGRIGLVGYWDCVAFDEFAANKRTDQNLVNIMKNYLANKSFSRGTSSYQAEASMVFIGNTTHTVPFMLKNSDLFDELPEAYRDSAWLDRLHCYIPGWEVTPIRTEMFSDGYGFVVDYMAETLRSLRAKDYSGAFTTSFTLDSSLSTRDQDGIRKTFSGLMKLIHPSGEASEDDMRVLLEYAIEGRKRVKDSILRIDATMRDTPVRFVYVDSRGQEHPVSTLEERQHPDLYLREWNEAGELEAEPTSENQSHDVNEHGTATSIQRAIKTPWSRDARAHQLTEPSEGYVDFRAGQKGVSYENLFSPYLRGAQRIEITDPYIRKRYQMRNLADLLSLIARLKDPADEVSVLLRTAFGPQGSNEEQEQILAFRELQTVASSEGIAFDVKPAETIHDRRIETDHGWRIDLGRGLDLWERPDDGDFSFGWLHQEFRLLKSDFTVHYLRVPASR